MKKMKSLFKKEFNNNKVTLRNEVTEGCEWVLNGEGIPTRKLDGTCVLINKGKLFARFDYKVGRQLPLNAIPCQKEADAITGHFPHWIEVTTQPQYKWHIKAFNSQQDLEDGTYELIGLHFNGNPENIVSGDVLVKHGSVVLHDTGRNFSDIKQFLENNNIEGIVYHRGNGEMCKIKRSDFNLSWNGKSTKH